MGVILRDQMKYWSPLPLCSDEKDIAKIWIRLISFLIKIFIIFAPLKNYSKLRHRGTYFKTRLFPHGIWDQVQADPWLVHYDAFEVVFERVIYYDSSVSDSKSSFESYADRFECFDCQKPIPKLVKLHVGTTV